MYSIIYTVYPLLLLGNPYLAGYYIANIVFVTTIFRELTLKLNIYHVNVCMYVTECW